MTRTSSSRSLRRAVTRRRTSKTRCSRTSAARRAAETLRVWDLEEVEDQREVVMEVRAEAEQPVTDPVPRLRGTVRVGDAEVIA